MSVYEKINTLLQEKSSLVVAIDGNCGSGKTTLAKSLAAQFDCNVIGMDDFFLPFPLRTEERLREPGGNVHYERFLEEVIKPIQQNKIVTGSPENKKVTITYRHFQCSLGTYDRVITLPWKPLTIIEGSYCMRPEFRSAYDYSIFLSCSKEEQERRILTRDGEAALQNFREKWIPMENRYFELLKVPEACSVRIQT